MKKKVLSFTWKPYKRGIMKAKVKDNLMMDMLIAGGRLRPMARYPNFDEKAVRFNGTSAQATAPERVKKWKNPAGGYQKVDKSKDVEFIIFRAQKENKIVIPGRLLD